MKKKSVLTLLLACSLVVSENGMPVFATQQEAAAPAEEDGVNRVVSFTDYTGMRVTYDANVSRRYVYEVTDGVLTAVKEKQIGEEALTTVSFEGNVELKQPEEGEKYTVVSADVFGGNQEITYVRLPVGVTSIAGESFKGCTALKSVYLPSTVREIGAGAFENCTAMTQISLPKSVTAIGDNAFRGDVKLQMLQLRDVEDSALASVGAHAFADCSSLPQMVLPQSVVTVGDCAFQGCTALTRVEVDCDHAAIGLQAFPGPDEAEGLVIVARIGSNAEAYAEENGLSFQEDRAHSVE